MSGPDVTFACITHNRPAMLEVQLLSMLASAAMVKPKGITTRIVVVDDASDTMEAKAITKRLGVDYKRLPENRGLAGALVVAFEQVDSPFYALWGDDDYQLPRWLPLHYAKMQEGFDVVAGSYWRADEDLRQLRVMDCPVATFADLKQGKVTCNDGALVRRDSVDPAWFRPERERAMVMTFWLAMASAGRKFAVIKEPTWLYRRHSGQLSEHSPSPHDMRLRLAAMAEYA